MTFSNRNQGLNVVIADDDATTRMALRLLLQEQLHIVAGEAADGERAIELCSAHKPHIVFLDIDMPKLSGNEAARRIRELHPNIGVVMISGVATMENVREAMQIGAASFVVKPFSAAKVVDAVNNCLKKFGKAAH
ncbi:MAG: response regulator [Proteobacteria bacterium]|nr:response regulator [Pseudomonadota bacterium]